jgi:hypothetical protein
MAVIRMIGRGVSRIVVGHLRTAPPSRHGVDIVDGADRAGAGLEASLEEGLDRDAK